MSITSGRWRAIGLTGAVGIYDEQGTRLATVARKADANAIAALPDLHAALQEIRSVARWFWDDEHPRIGALDAAFKRADEALGMVDVRR